MRKSLDVRLEGGHWVVVGGRGRVVSRHDTQQVAIEAAKIYARQLLGEVSWRDRQGRPQGMVTYKLYAKPNRQPWWARLLMSYLKPGDLRRPANT
jgi:photosystem II stability/assembly factor-like uncharacterized protein